MYIIILNILVSSLYIVLRSKKNLHILQQNFYNENNRYLKWGNKNLNQVFRLDFFVLIINILNLFIKNSFLALVSIFYLIFLFIEYKKGKSV